MVFPPAPAAPVPGARAGRQPRPRGSAPRPRRRRRPRWWRTPPTTKTVGKLCDAAIARGALSEGDADRFTDAIASGAMSEADCIDEWRQRLGVTSAAEL